jgi:hypothetical protein
MAFMPFGAAGIFVAILAATMMFAAMPGRGAGAGLRFGLLLGVFVVGATVMVNHATITFATDHSMKMTLAACIEWMSVGTVIGVVYKPSAAGRRL